MSKPEVRFLSLFVPDLQDAAARYEAVFGVPPSNDPGHAPVGHPFAAAGPVVFDLGPVALALYQCDMRATHPGDVGIGLVIREPSGTLVERAESRQGTVLLRSGAAGAQEGELAIFMLPDRHFFEIKSRPA